MQYGLREREARSLLDRVLFSDGFEDCGDAIPVFPEEHRIVTSLSALTSPCEIDDSQFGVRHCVLLKMLGTSYDIRCLLQCWPKQR